MPLKTPELTKFTTASQSVVTYNYTDVANGLGVSNFYAAPVADSTGSSYILTPDTFPGGKSGVGDLSTHPVLAGNVAELDFDLSAFNITQTVKGTATISCTMYRTSLTATCKFQLKKWDGTSETNISSQITSATESTTTTTITKVNPGFELPLFSLGLFFVLVLRKKKFI